MKVSVNTIKQLIDFELPSIDELVAKINTQLGGVDEVVDLGAKYAGARVVRVVSCDKHPDADKLTVCKIDDGGAVADIERDDQGLVQVVCGAPNVHADMWAVWLPPRTTVPSSYDDAEPFVLDARKLRGVMSQGMLAAGDELAINNDHDGIVEITERDVAPGTELRVGASFAELFGLDDTIIDIENKMFTHRPDCFGQLGVAREIAGIFGQQFTSPEWYLGDVQFAAHDELPLEVYNDAGDKAPRFMTVVMRDVTVGPSPLWLQATLVRWGVRPINNVVDITNYVMLFTAQPVHAYDYDKIRGGKLGVRMAREGETLTLLSGKECALRPSDIVIADGEGVLGLAGIMGGAASEVSQQTRTIVLEVANFDMYALRKSAMHHGVFTDALARFNKGQSPMQCPKVLQYLMQQLGTHTGAVQASNVADCTTQELHDPLPLTIAPQKIRSVLGMDMSKYDMVQLLGNVEFPLCQDCGWNPEDKEDNEDELHVNPPFWRMDIECDEDVIEELGRLYGFDRLPRALPLRRGAPAQRHRIRETKQRIRQAMKQAGANEVLSYSFVNKRLVEGAGQDVSQAFELGNALSPDLQYYRLSVLPSLLDKVHANIKAGHDEFVLHEIGKGHNKKYHADDDEGLPRELNFVDAVYASKRPHEGAALYHVRALIDAMAAELGFGLVVTPADTTMEYPVTAPFELSRSAMVESDSGEFIGMIGEIKQSVRQHFKLPEYTAAMTLDLEGIDKAHRAPTRQYRALSKFPSTSQDISLRVDVDATVADVQSVVAQAADEHRDDVSVQVSLLGIYQSTDDTQHKTMTFRLVFVHDERTLTDDDVKPIMDHIACAALTKLDAERV